MFFGITLLGITAGAQTLPASVTKQANATSQSNSTIKKVNKGAKKVETTAENTSKYSNNNLIGKTKGGANKVKDITAN